MRSTGAVTRPFRRCTWSRMFQAGLIAAMVGSSLACNQANGQKEAPAAPVAADNSAAALAFRSAVTGPPAGWTGPVFALSHDYPATAPAQCSQCGWLKVDPVFTPAFPQPGPRATPKSATEQGKWTTGKWDAYLAAILSYVREGQDPDLADAVGFRSTVNGGTRWFNVPWMAYDPTVGREFVHGTTNERTAVLKDLVGSPGAHPAALGLGRLTGSCAERYPNGFETWAVGYYNEWGGAAIGGAIPGDGVPRVTNYAGAPILSGLPFPEGTAVVKILTTNAPVDCVPYLAGSPEWQIDRHTVYTDGPKKGKYSCDRVTQTSRVVQVDVAVVDSRSPMRWVYGTFAYDGRVGGTTFWDRLVPVGIQFGADPWTFPAVPRAESIPAQQSVLNPGLMGTDRKLFEHFGCEGRLAGPVDNALSSCVSCHSSALVAPVGTPLTMGVNAPMSYGFPGMCTQYSAYNAAYFSNIVPPQTFGGGQYPDSISVDTSLQLEVAVGQYGQFKAAGAPVACPN